MALLVADPGQVLPRGGVEQVNAFGVEPQRGLVAIAHPAQRIELDAELGPQLFAVQLVREIGQLRDDFGRRLERDERILFVAQPLGDVDGDVEGDAAGLLARIHELGVLEGARPDACDVGLAVLDHVAPLIAQRNADEGELDPVAADAGRHEVHRRRPDEPRDEQVDGLVVELTRAGDLLQHALLQHRNPIAERHGLGLVVGDVDGGDPESALQPEDLGPHLTAQLGVEVAQRLVEQERVGLAHDRPAHRHPLALAAGEIGGLAVEVLDQVECLGGVGHQLADLVVGVLAGQAKWEGDVLEDGQVRVERVVLEHHRQVAIPGRLVVDPGVADHHVTGGDVLKADDHPQQGRLPAPRRADQDHELAVGDVDAHVVDGGEAVTVLLDDVAHGDCGHGYPFTAPEVSPATMRRWKTRTRMTTGMVTITDAAMM